VLGDSKSKYGRDDSIGTGECMAGTAGRFRVTAEEEGDTEQEAVAAGEQQRYSSRYMQQTGEL